MIVFPPLRLHLDLYLRRALFLSLCAAAVTFLFMGLLACFPAALRWEGGSDFASPLKTETMRPVCFVHEMIATGPLALRPSYPQGWVARLADELSFIAYNSRPDMPLERTRVLLGFKYAKEQLALPNATLLSLKESAEGKGLLPSQEVAPFWAKPLVLDSGSILVEVGRALTTQEGQKVEEQGQFIANVQGGASRYNPSQKDFALECLGASGFPYDLLMQKYGGREFASLGNQAVLELASERGSYALFVSAGSYLQYEEGQWRAVSFEEIKATLPVAHVSVASKDKIELTLWDAQGFYPVPVKIEMKKPQAAPFAPEMMPTSVRLRSGTQVSCAFGKRRLILKQGDWLLRTGHGWRHLRTSEEIQLYLQRRLKGDLFIFDTIEKEAQGKLILKGNLFDETHTLMQSVSLPINIEKQQSKMGRKRRAALQGNRK